MIDLENVQQIASIETLIQLLKKRVGSPLSYSSLARDLNCSDKTVKRWLAILESMYVIFRVPPFHKNIAQSILKSPKIYFYDNRQVMGEPGVKLENLVACALLKEIHFKQDCFGEDRQLYYIRNKDGKEIDFLITKEDEPKFFIEVKWSDENLTTNFSKFEQYLSKVKKIQVVKNLNREKTFPDKSEIRSACKWLSDFSL